MTVILFPIPLSLNIINHLNLIYTPTNTHTTELIIKITITIHIFKNLTKNRISINANIIPIKHRTISSINENSIPTIIDSGRNSKHFIFPFLG